VLTRCPACATHFRVTPEQLKVRSGRVRCGECQQIFNALDTLIEEPVLAMMPPARPPVPTRDIPASSADSGTEAVASPEAGAGKIVLPQTAVPEAGVEATEEPLPLQPASEEPALAGQGQASPLVPAESAELPDIEPELAPPGPGDDAPVEAEVAALEVANETPTEEVAETETATPEQSGADTATGAGTEVAEWAETFPEPLPSSRRWPWVIGSLIALVAIGLQSALAFRVELAVLWPEGKPALVALCEIAGCEVGLPAKVGQVGIEASDLHPDTTQPGRLVLTATLKNRAPFAQQFPHLELTLTDTADKAVARKVLTPGDYLPAKSSVADGMPSSADIPVSVGVDARDMTASGYRLYLFYP
jgi:predicted Zn finger-like uncharacterized protein